MFTVTVFKPEQVNETKLTSSNQEPSGTLIVYLSKCKIKLIKFLIYN